ncbi:MAG: hypothetical protein WAU61_04590 [Smithella sp.]
MTKAIIAAPLSLRGASQATWQSIFCTINDRGCRFHHSKERDYHAARGAARNDRRK